MTKLEKLNLMKNRLATLENTSKNLKAGGCVRKLRRQIRNLEKEV